MRHLPVLTRSVPDHPVVDAPVGDGRVWRPWLLAWPGMVAVALVNGTFRGLVTQPLLGETAARQLATVLLLCLLVGYQGLLVRRFPLPSSATALAIGGAWATMTLVFEFGFGRFVEHLSWSTMLADYDLTAGRIWVLVPVWLVIGPATIRGLRQRTSVAR
jgi:hypothetical protein